MLISNCDKNYISNKREEYLRELMKYINIDSFGLCFNNKVKPKRQFLIVKEWPKDIKQQPWWEAKWELISRYKFVIAFENAITEDYVTEKLFHSFIVGTVPSTL